MPEFFRGELERILNDSLIVKRCDKSGSLQCQKPHWFSEIVKPGANLLVKVDRGFYRILNVLRLEPVSTDFPLKSINSWKDCTRMNAFTVDAKLTYFCEDALSFNKCLNHSNCSIVGVHIIDVVSYYPDEPTEKNDNVRTEIRQNIFVNTGSTISIRGYKHRLNQASISIFLHTSLNVEENFAQTKPEATMIRISRQYSFQDVEKQAREGYCEVDWKTLFEFAWKFRQYDNTEEPIYTFYNTWVSQDPDGYVPSLIVQMYTRIMSKAISIFLWRKKIPFPAIHFTLKISDKFETDFAKYIPYAISVRSYYKYLLNEKDESLSVDDPDETIEVIVLTHIWDQLVMAAYNVNVVQCGGILHAHHIHPFLVETYHNLFLSFKRVVVEDFEYELASKSFDKVYVNFSRPGRELESILIQRICHHSSVSDEIRNVTKFIKKKFEDKLDEESTSSEDEEKDEDASEERVIGDDENTNCEVNEEESPKDEDEAASNIRAANEISSPATPWKEDFKHLLSQPLILGKTEDEVFTFPFLTLENNELKCCKIRSKDWLEMQNNLLCLGSNLPFDVEKAHKLCRSILEADKEKVPKETYKLNKVTGEFKDIAFYAKPIHYHEYSSDNLRRGTTIISITNDIHNCSLHLTQFSVAFPFYAQPYNWAERCARSTIFQNVQLELLEGEYFQVIKPADNMQMDFPKPDQMQFVCITTWYERCVFFAHGENVVWEQDPSSSVIKILSSLRCQRTSPLLQTHFSYTIEFS